MCETHFRKEMIPFAGSKSKKKKKKKYIVKNMLTDKEYTVTTDKWKVKKMVVWKGHILTVKVKMGFISRKLTACQSSKWKCNIYYRK